MTWSELGIDLKARTSGEYATTCPKCSHDRKKKRAAPLSVNITKGVFNCNHCGWKGGIGDAVKFEKKKEYKLPQVNNTELSDKALKWFQEIRKISKATVIRFKLSESKEWMPQTEKIENCINFNYFRNEQLVNIKFRDAKKNFKLVSQAELIFYGLDLIEGQKTIVICEGEIDALSFYESGITSVVSVPNGASKGSQKLEYLDNCWQWFQSAERIILATDSDAPGIELREELARRLGKERCLIVSYPEGCKDANEVLIKCGPEVLNKMVQDATDWPLEGIKTVEDFTDRINDIYNNGYPKGANINYTVFDRHLSFIGGQFTVVTGIPGSGKSEFSDQIFVNLSKNHDWKWGVFSAENQPEEYHFIKLAEKLKGKSFHSDIEQYKMNVDEVGDAAVFINDHFYFVNMEEANISIDGLLDKCKELVLRKGINGFIIDPWNYVEHKIPQGYTETQYISEALTKVSRAAKMNDVHIFVVVHPTKIQKESDTGKYRVATLYDCAGSAHWFNKCDNGISVYRDFETDVVDVHIQKVRFKWIGKIGKASFEWDKFTGRYSEILQ